MLYLAQINFASRSISNSKTFQHEKHDYFTVFLQPFWKKIQLRKKQRFFARSHTTPHCQLLKLITDPKLVRSSPPSAGRQRAILTDPAFHFQRWHLSPWLGMIMWQVATLLSRRDQLRQIGWACTTPEASLVHRFQPSHPRPITFPYWPRHNGWVNPGASSHTATHSCQVSAGSAQQQNHSVKPSC